MQGEDPLGSDRQPIDMKPSTDHLMQSMAIGYPGPRTKMDGKDKDDGHFIQANEIEMVVWMIITCMTIGYPGPRTKMDGNIKDDGEALMLISEALD